MNTLRSIAAVAVLLFTAHAAVADEVRLTNGDRLTGTVVSLAGGTVTFKTPHGELKLPWGDVLAIRIERQVLVTTKTAPAQLMTLDSASPTVAPLAEIVAIADPAPPVVWSGGANAGLLTTGGNTDVSSLRLGGEITARTARDRYNASVVVNHAQDAGEDTAENWTSTFTYNRFLSKRMFVDANAILTNDRFRDIDLRTALGVGIGYQVWDRPSATLSVNGGYGWVNENFDTAPDDDYSALREGVKLDLFFAGRRLQAFHHHDGYFGVTGDDNLFFRMQNGVRALVTGALVATLQVDVDYDRSPAPGRVNTDRSLGLTLGVRF